MQYEISPSHVAVLVPSARKAADYLKQFGFEIGPDEEFEETKEIYIQGGEKNSLLLMEAKETGSYARALKKRGPGFHHFAVDVLDLEGFLGTLGGSGWLLHLNSLKMMKHRTVYLARPGFPGLIEVQEKKTLVEGPSFVEGISLGLQPAHAGMVKAVGLNALMKAGEPGIMIRGKKIELAKLF